MKLILKLFLFLMCSFYITSSFSWQRGISIAYGSGNEIDQNYRNRGVIIAGKLFKFPKIDDTLIATLDVSASEFHATTDHDKLLRTISIGIAPRAYFAPPECYVVKPYLGTSLGPCYLSAKRFGTREQGAHLAFQITLESGVEIDLDKRSSLDLNLRLIHFCNAGIFDPNEAINLFPTFGIGYLFG